MSNFPSLQPALTVDIVLGEPLRVGPVSNGAPVTCVPLVGGTLRSVDGGVLSGLIDAECVNGLDTSRANPDFEYVRLDINSVWRNKDDAKIFLSYDALLKLTDMTKLIFSGHPDAKSTEFGNIFARFKFETGDAKLKALEENMFVGSGRMVAEPGKMLRVEYNISIVVQ